MSGLFSSLNASVGALAAQSRAVETAGKNLANVNNPSYSRQRVIFGDRGTIITPQGAQSMGVEALGVEQLRDTLLDRQVVREISQTAYDQSQQDGFRRAQAALGQDVASAGAASSANSTTGDTGVAAALDDMFNAFQSFSANPTDTGQRQGVIQKVSILTDRIQLADTRLSQVQSDLNNQVATDVTTTNQLLQTINNLNSQISRFEVNLPRSAVDLRDQRQAAVEKLAATLPIDVTDVGSKLQISSKDSSGNPVVLLDTNGVQGTVALVTTTVPPSITAGSPATKLALAGGSLGGAIGAGAGAVQVLRTQLDNLARQLVTSVNALYNPGGGSTNFFTASGTTAATISLQSGITAATLRASNGGAAGDNTVALAIAGLASQKFSTTAAPTPDFIDGTFGTFFSGAVSGLGQAVAGAVSRVNDQTRIEQLVRGQRDAVSGVSLDEEMANLMKYQRAFQASSRVFQIVDSLLENVVTQMGR